MVKKLYDLKYEIRTTKDEDSFTMPFSVLKLYTLDEKKNEIGFLPGSRVEEIEIELHNNSIPAIVELIIALKKDLFNEQAKLMGRIKEEAIKEIVIKINVTEELSDDEEVFKQFEKELIELFEKFGLTGICTNFTTGKQFTFPIKSKDYKI